MWRLPVVPPRRASCARHRCAAHSASLASGAPHRSLPTSARRRWPTARVSRRAANQRARSSPRACGALPNMDVQNPQPCVARDGFTAADLADLERSPVFVARQMGLNDLPRAPQSSLEDPTRGYRGTCSSRANPDTSASGYCMGLPLTRRSQALHSRRPHRCLVLSA